MKDLIPCPFCGKGEFEYRENTYWTGMRSVLISVDLNHWCGDYTGLPRQKIYITAKTKEDCILKWNERYLNLD